MDNNAENSPPEVSPAAARQAIGAVTELETITTWRPARWAVGLVAVCFAVAIATFSWEEFWWGFGALAGMAVLLAVLRRRLFNPYTRERPWQSLDNQESISKKDRWWYATFPLWVPTTILIPTEPAWIGLLFGTCAGVHLYYAVKDFGATR